MTVGRCGCWSALPKALLHCRSYRHASCLCLQPHVGLGRAGLGVLECQGLEKWWNGAGKKEVWGCQWVAGLWSR